MSEDGASNGVACPQRMLDTAADSLSPEEMRLLASQMLKVADAVDQNWTSTTSQSIFRWPNEKRRIERDAYILAETADLEYRQRRRRQNFVPSDCLAEPAWDMLLELFMQYAGRARVSVSSLTIAAHCPASTALRYVGLLENAGLVRRIPSATDKRVTFVELTDNGVLAMGRYLSDVP